MSTIAPILFFFPPLSGRIHKTTQALVYNPGYKERNKVGLDDLLNKLHMQLGLNKPGSIRIPVYVNTAYRLDPDFPDQISLKSNRNGG